MHRYKLSGMHSFKSSIGIALTFQVENQLLGPPIVTGFSVLGLGVSLGYNCGYAVNPARDLAPRVFSGKAAYPLDTCGF